MSRLLFVAFLLSTNLTFSNNNPFDKAYHHIAQKQYDSAIYEANRILTNSESKWQSAQCKNIIAYVLKTQNKLDLSLSTYYDAALDILVADTSDLHLENQVFNMIGVIHKKYGNHQKAIEYYDRALEAANNVSSTNETIIMYNKAIALAKLKNPACIDVFNESMNLARKYDQSRWVANTINQLGLVFLDMGRDFNSRNQKDSATYCFDRAKSYFRQMARLPYSIKKPRYTGFAYNNLGETAIEEQDSDSAIYWLNMSLATKKNHSELFISHKNLGELYLNLQDFDKSIEHLVLADSCPGIELNRENLEYLKYLAIAYDSLNNSRMSSLYENRYQAKLEELITQLSKADVLPDLSYQEVVIEKEKAIQNAPYQLIKRSNLKYTIASIAIVLMLVLGAVYYFKRRSDREFLDEVREINSSK